QSAWPPRGGRPSGPGRCCPTGPGSRGSREDSRWNCGVPPPGRILIVRLLPSGLPGRIRPHRFGILLAGEFFPVGHPHHIGENLEAVAVGIEEVERATAAAAEVAAPFEAVDEWSTDQLDPLRVQVGQGLEERITVLDLKGDLLDQPLAGAG